MVADIFDVRDEEFSAMCKWSNHCLHHLLPSDLTVGVEYILISWFVILALLGVASLFVCCMIHCKHLR